MVARGQVADISVGGNVVWVGSEASKSEGQAGVQCRGLAQSLGFEVP